MRFIQSGTKTGRFKSSAPNYSNLPKEFTLMNPENDGVDHINIYSKGKTELGRWLTNWAHEPIETDDGPFECIEGYWFWLGTRDSRFRKLRGWGAKKLGKELPRTIRLDEKQFKAKIKQALRVKAAKRPDMMQKLKESELPLTHYYVYGGKSVPAGFEWITQFWEEMRK